MKQVGTHKHLIDRQRGLSLIELMISMTLGLITIAAIGWIYLGTTQAYRTQDALARLQENARYAFEVISNDLRMTGASGCGVSSTGKGNVVPNFNSTAVYADLFGRPLTGFEQNGAGLTTISDAIRVLHADVSRENIVTAHDTAGRVLTIGTHSFPVNSYLLATDCDRAVVFTATAVGGSTVTHNANLGNAGAVYTMSAGSRVYGVTGATYYVATNPAGQPALYRETSGGSEELVEGVEDLQISYGVDTDAAPDGAPNFNDPDGDGDPYLTATQVQSGTVPGASAADKWTRVVSVRMSLLMRTVENNIVPQVQTYNFNGADHLATDRRLRKVFTHVVKVRNR